MAQAATLTAVAAENPACTYLHIDFETRSDRNIKTVGNARYFASKWTDALMASYSFDGYVIKRWRRGQPCPPEIIEHVERGGKIVAHNAAFERSLWRTVLAPKYGWPLPRDDQFECSLATASYMGLPRALETLANALKLPVRKNKSGEELIKHFSMPRAFAEDGTPIFNEPEDFPEKFESFHDYCDDDVRTEAMAYDWLFHLSDSEQEIWLLDQTINQRGVRIDRRSVEAAIRLVDEAQAKLDEEMQALTFDPLTGLSAVHRCSEVQKIITWIEQQGVPLPSAAKSDILAALALDNLPTRVREALLLRKQFARSSTSKLKAFMKRVTIDDDRLRFMFTYRGAGPGRWTSQGINLANLPRPRPMYDKEKEKGRLGLPTLFKVIRRGVSELLPALYGDVLGAPLDMMADALRSFLWAAPGHDLIAVDYSSIQGRIAMWLSGEEWKLEAVRKIDADPANEPDLYRRAAALIMGMTTDVITKKHPLRQSVGKTSELALGFQSGVAGFVAMARNYNVDLDEIFEPVWSAADEETREKALKRYERCCRARDKVKTDELSKEAWLACECVKIKWRQTNPKIAEAWTLLENAVRQAVANPGKQFRALDKVDYLVSHGYLICKLPSGNCIHYSAPRLKAQVWARLKFEDGTWPEDAEVVDRDEAEQLEARGLAQIDGATSAKVTVAGVVGSEHQKFQRYALYGGLLMENLCLAIERDILAAGMLRCEARGYPIVYHNYDEAVAEMPRGVGSLEEMTSIMCEQLSWTGGLPIAGEGWRGKRYRK
jgi:DNA polymerase